MSLAKVGHLRPIVRNRDLRLLLAAGLVSQTGDWLLATGLSFQIYALTGSTVASAATLFATQLPQVLFGSVAGVFVDRWDSRRVIVVANLLLSVILVPLFVVRDASQVWVVVVVVAASSCLTPFSLAAQMTLLPTLVDEDELVTANAANAQVQNVARLVGAAAGGVLITTGGLLWLAIADIATFLLAASLVGLIRHRRQRGYTARLHFGRDWVEGVGAIRGSRALIVIVVFFAVSGLGEATMGTLFAPFVADVIGGSGTAFGTIMAAQAVGGIAGGLLVTAVGHRFRPQTLFAWGAVAFGIGDLALFLYPLVNQQVWPAMLIIAVVGLPGAALFAGMLTVFQTNTPGQVRGRVFGVLTTVQNLVMLAATFAAGGLAEPLGIVPVISVQGVVYALVGVAVLIALRGQPTRAPTAGIGEPLDTASGGLLDNPANFIMLPSMALASNVRTQTVHDPLAMRALAHPLRLQLHALVAREGSLTAADAARQLNISHALASHHLRQLAKYGFLEPAESSDNKQHPWRVTATNLSLQPAEPEAQASADVLDRYAAERATQRLLDWQDRRDQEDTAWIDLAGVRDSILYLTPGELSQVLEAWTEIVGPLAAERPIGHADQRPHDTVPVNLTLIAVPIERTEKGG